MAGGIGDKLSTNIEDSHTASNATNKSVEIDYPTTIDVREEANTTLKGVEEEKKSMNASQDTTAINGQNAKSAIDDSGYVEDTEIPVSATGIK